MKTLSITTIVTATVEETWTFQVPDDFEVPADDSEALDYLNSNTPGEVENTDIYDERDRVVTHASLLD